MMWKTMSTIALLVLSSMLSACHGSTRTATGDVRERVAVEFGQMQMVAANRTEIFPARHMILTFAHPAAWKRSHFSAAQQDHRGPLGASAALLYLSNQAMRAPCHATVDGGSCGLPVRTLVQRGVLVLWSVADRRGGQASVGGSTEPSATTMTIDGNRVTEIVGKGGDCTGTKADVTLTASIDHGNGIVYSLLACLRGPNVDAARRHVQAMLASVHIAG